VIGPGNLAADGAAPELSCDDYAAPGNYAYVTLHNQHLDKLAHEIGHVLGCSHGATDAPVPYPKDEKDVLRRTATKLAAAKVPAKVDPCPKLHDPMTNDAALTVR